MHVCIVYDCLFPWTIGGAERWYRNLAERLVEQGFQVTYLTLRQWDKPPVIDGVEVVAVGPQMALYRDGKRRITPPLRFGIGVFAHLARHGRRYDVVHTASFPYFSLIAASLVRPFAGFRVICDWHEVWSADYWRSYLGPLGRVGQAVQWLCAQFSQRAYTFSQLHRGRLAALGQEADVLTGEYAPEREPSVSQQADHPPRVVYAGRFIPEKRVELLVDALALACANHANLRATLVGEGPTLAAVRQRISALGLTARIECPGFLSAEELDRTMAGAACIAQPSSREGYGMVVVEAAHRGVPVALVAGKDNAAVELIEQGTNGFVAQTADAPSLAEAIERCLSGGSGLRTSTRAWFETNRQRLSLNGSLTTIVHHYRGFAGKSDHAQSELVHA